MRRFALLLLALLALSPAPARAIVCTGTGPCTVTVKGSCGVEPNCYASLNLALAGEATDLTAETALRVLTIECYASAAPDTTSATTGTGYITSASYYINITVPTAERHSGVYSDTKYRIEKTNGSGLTISEAHVRVTGLQVKITSDNASVYHGIVMSSVPSGLSSEIRINNVISVGAISSNTSASVLSGINDNDADAVATVTNSIAYGWVNGTPTGNGFRTGSSGTSMTAAHCTAYGNYIGFNEAATTMTLVNCLATDNAGGDYGTTPTMTYSASGDTSSSGTGCEDDHNPAYTSETLPYNLLPTTSTEDIGTTSGLPAECATDIKGVARTDPYTVGAFEYVAASTAIPWLQRCNEVIQ